MSSKRLQAAPVDESGTEGGEPLLGQQSAEPVSRVGSEPRSLLTRGQCKHSPSVRRRQSAAVTGPEPSTPLDFNRGDHGDRTDLARSQVAGPDQVIHSSRADAQP